MTWEKPLDIRLETGAFIAKDTINNDRVTEAIKRRQALVMDIIGETKNERLAQIFTGWPLHAITAKVGLAESGDGILRSFIQTYDADRYTNIDDMLGQLDKFIELQKKKS